MGSPYFDAQRVRLAELGALGCAHLDHSDLEAPRTRARGQPAGMFTGLRQKLSYFSEWNACGKEFSWGTPLKNPH